MLTRDRLRLVFFSAKFSAWTSSFPDTSEEAALARLSAVGLFISRELSGRQALPIIAFLVLNLICSLTQFWLQRLIMPWFISLFFFFGYTTIWKELSTWSIQLQAGTTPLKGWSHLIDFFIFSLCLFSSSDYLKLQQEKCCCTSNDWK